MYNSNNRVSGEKVEQSVDLGSYLSDNSIQHTNQQFLRFRQKDLELAQCHQPGIRRLLAKLAISLGREDGLLLSGWPPVAEIGETVT